MSVRACLCSISILLIAGACFAQPGNIADRQYAKVVGHGELEERRHAPLRWAEVAGRVNPATGARSVSHVTVDRYATIQVPTGDEVAAQSFQYDFAQHYYTAIRLWAGQNAQGQRDPRVANAIPYHVDASNPTITFGVESPSWPTAALGFTYINSRPIRVMLNPLNLGRRVAADYSRARTAGIIGRDVPVAAYLDMVVRQTVVHELGHAYGLMHPDAELGRAVIVLDEYYVELLPAPLTANVDPSIMLAGEGGQFLYLSQLHQRLGRAITLDDIRPSERDLLGASLQWRGLAQRSVIQMSLQMLTSCVAGATCTGQDEL